MPESGDAASGMLFERLVDDLQALGVRAGDRLMVHASLRKLGLAFPGGAELILDALDSAVGPDGTLLMMIGTDYAQDWVNRRPEAERAALLAGTPPLDCRNAPASPEVGWLGEAFRRRAGTIVSDNPSGRFAARGRDAEALLRDAPWHDYYGPGSPLERLCESGGRILRLGANPDTVTALHYAEYLARLPGKRRVRWHFIVEGAAGPVEVHTECLDDSAGILPWEGEDYFALILKVYLTKERGRIGMVGKARSELIEASDLVNFGARWMEENLPRGRLA